jgi:hypothetical protein
MSPGGFFSAATLLATRATLRKRKHTSRDGFMKDV